MSTMKQRAVSSSPFTQVVFASIRRLYPPHLADTSFDNTGVLLEAPFNSSKEPNQNLRDSVLLAIDLTTAVADEAIRRRDSVVIAYHPIIFRGLKSLTLQDTQQSSLLKLAAEGISVYCPHTAVDAAKGGNGDWLADVVSGSFVLDADEEDEKQFKGQEYAVYEYPVASGATPMHGYGLPHTRKVIQSDKSDPEAGFGRILEFEQPIALSLLLDNIAAGVGQPKAFKIALPQGSKVDDIRIRTVGVCAGSGSHTLAGQDVDLLLTGELDHHAALSEIEQGHVVVALNHSNSERGYLTGVMQPKLAKLLKEEWKETSEVAVSKADKDPFSFVIRED